MVKTLEAMAKFYCDRDTHLRAEPLYQRVLTIRQEALPHAHPEVNRSTENYAAVLRQTGHFDKADTGPVGQSSLGELVDVVSGVSLAAFASGSRPCR